MLGHIKRYLMENTKYGKSRYLNFLHSYDMSRYLKYSCMNENNHKLLAVEMRLLIHPLEKALSLKNIRPGFGTDKVKRLIALYEEYSKINGNDQQVLQLTESIILNYIDFQKQHNMDLSFIPDKFFDSNADKSMSGAIDFTEEEFSKLSGFEQICNNRHSIRNFAPQKLSRDDLTAAVKLAQTAPSACKPPVNTSLCVLQSTKNRVYYG